MEGDIVENVVEETKKEVVKDPFKGLHPRLVAKLKELEKRNLLHSAKAYVCPQDNFAKDNTVPKK